ncbi:MAG TPA: PQQ-dependent sugar dehydrogenase [Gammaproteobacteria bacterium]
MKATSRALPSIHGAAGLVAAAALAISTSALAQPPGPAGEQFKVVTYVEGLRNPWSMAWLPNGDMLVTERGAGDYPGSLRIIRNGKLLPTPVPGVPAVRAQGQGGMQEVAVHPNFAQNHFIYLSYAKPRNDGMEGTTSLMRAKLEGDKLVEAKEIFEAKAWSNSPGHFGARIAFDGQGHLFLSSGDRMAGLFPRRPDGAMDPNLEGHPSQKLDNHQGKILRLNDDGTVPQDNPFVGRAGALPEIWSYGHRNPQGLMFDPATNTLWETEHGPQGGDELNVIEKGKNYGWPVIGYGANYTLGTEIHASRNKEGMEQPKAFFVPSIGISGAMLYTGDKFPNWKGNIFVGGMSANYRQLVRFSINGHVVTNREPLLVQQYRIRDVRQGPDGFVYIATDNQFPGQPSNIIRLEPNAQ